MAFTWWQTGVVYQVYPRSFMDADGDGVGDLRGIAARLDHLKWLGVDAAWISPIFKSPMVDMGYDVEDYRAIDPRFGTMADFDALVRATHERGMKLLLDFVPNHTSDRHAWFQESRSSRTSPKRDWYLWRDPAPDGGPPNNWKSVFGGPAWELDAATGQYYYHAYLKEQPDLNWRNPEVERAMHDVVRFWLEKGVDGFRIDVLWHLIKDDQFRDNPPNPEWKPGQTDAKSVLPIYTTDRPEVFPVIRRLRRVFDEFPERVMIGEIYLPVERLAAYCGTREEPLADLPFNFSLVWPVFAWRADHLAATITRYESALPPHGWPNWVLGNHDVKRIASRVGGDAQARVAAFLLLTLRGTPTIYQGDELGIADVPIPPDRVTDTRERTQPGAGRDPVRTPMPWDATAHAGFSTREPWLPLNPDHATRNVASMRAAPDSILGLHQRLLAMRRREPALSTGAIRNVDADGAVLRYDRTDGARTIACALNLTSAPQTTSLRGRILASTHLPRENTDFTGALLPDEALALLPTPASNEQSSPT